MTQSYSGALWHVCMVETGAEVDTAEDIHDTLGHQVFVPAERVWTIRRGRRVQACKPLFPGYIFPRVDPYREDWSRLRGIDGVIDVLGAPREHDGIPSHVPDAAIDALRKAQDAGVFDRTKVAPDGYAIGETVRISEGPFAGHNAAIQAFVAKMRSATARKRARLLVQFLGRMCQTEVDVTALEKL
ncbi:MAG TPA: transcription termination/antitermination NusG family protein [Hyphomicrobiaceae bacterium]|nr:transcription termination/antitermination NusG family protein [Hyphomicrobiaceae bacterium]